MCAKLTPLSPKVCVFPRIDHQERWRLLFSPQWRLCSGTRTRSNRNCQAAAALDHARPPWAPVALVYPCRYTPTRLPDTPLSVSPPAGCLRDVTLTAGRVWGGSGRGWEMGRVKFTSQPKSADRFQTRIQAADPHRDRRVFPRAVNNGAATLRSVARLALSSRYTKSRYLYSHVQRLQSNLRSQRSHFCRHFLSQSIFELFFFPLINQSNRVVVWRHPAASLTPLKAPILPLPG